MKHWSDCATHNSPAMEPGECDCGGYFETECAGMMCTTVNGKEHSMECQAEHAAAIAGGVFIKGTLEDFRKRTRNEAIQECLDISDAVGDGLVSVGIENLLSE